MLLNYSFVNFENSEFKYWSRESKRVLVFFCVSVNEMQHVTLPT